MIRRMCYFDFIELGPWLH